MSPSDAFPRPKPCGFTRLSITILSLILCLSGSPAAFSAEIRIAWDPNSEPDLAGYKVYYGMSSGAYGPPLSVGNVTTYTLADLTPGQTYFIAVKATDTSYNDSGFSNEVSGVAADPILSYNITTDVPGLQITVDGATYYMPQSFTWTPGSSHTVSVPSPQYGGTGTQYVFAFWSDGGAQSHTITVPSSSITYTASFVTQYSLTTSVTPPGGGTVSPPGVNWYNSGDSVSVSAIPNAGYAFSSWTGGPGSTNPAMLTMSWPRSVTANFTAVAEIVSIPATPTGSTSGVTDTSYSYSTGGSTSTLGHSVEYQFDWKGDGTDLSAWGATTQAKVWTVVGTYQVRARARCVSHTGIVSGWSNGLTLSIGLAPVSCTVATNPSGLQIAVDGTTYTASRAFSWVPGSTHTVSVSSPQSGGTGIQYVFSSWSDGGAQSHTITVPSSSATYTASFVTQYSLTTSVTPPGGGTVSPPGVNWYNSGQDVSVSGTASAGYSFSSWTGDLSGSTSPGFLTLNGPRSATANFIQNQYTLTVTVNPSAGGSVTKSPNSPTYVYGEQVTLTAAANSGYSFSGWSGDASGTTSSTTIMIDSNKDVSAAFAPEQFFRIPLKMGMNLVSFPTISGEILISDL
ncbi:MAG: fibronectin type III domain-containing protein, partial [Pseudomonadota bacterium]